MILFQEVYLLIMAAGVSGLPIYINNSLGGSHFFPVGHFQYFKRRKPTAPPLTGGTWL